MKNRKIDRHTNMILYGNIMLLISFDIIINNNILIVKTLNLIVEKCTENFIILKNKTLLL